MGFVKRFHHSASHTGQISLFWWGALTVRANDVRASGVTGVDPIYIPLRTGANLQTASHLPQACTFPHCHCFSRSADGEDHRRYCEQKEEPKCPAYAFRDPTGTLICIYTSSSLLFRRNLPRGAFWTTTIGSRPLSLNGSARIVGTPKRQW